MFSLDENTPIELSEEPSAEDQAAEEEKILEAAETEGSEAIPPVESEDILEPVVETVDEPAETSTDALTTEPEEIPDAPAPEEPVLAAEEPVEESSSSIEEPDDGRAWFVVHCYSGYENKVRHNLEQRIETMGMKDMIFDVVVPTEEEVEVKDGKRRTVERRVFPGYILVNMLMSEESWYVVRNTPGVTSFVGMGNEPVPLRPEEVSQIIKRMEADAPRIKVSFRQGERVRIIDGPFNDFRGTVDEIDMERAKVRVMVNFFGRETPVELDFLQVEKA